MADILHLCDISISYRIFVTVGLIAAKIQGGFYFIIRYLIQHAITPENAI